MFLTGFLSLRSQMSTRESQPPVMRMFGFSLSNFTQKIRLEWPGITASSPVSLYSNFLVSSSKTLSYIHALDSGFCIIDILSLHFQQPRILNHQDYNLNYLA